MSANNSGSYGSDDFRLNNSNIKTCNRKEETPRGKINLGGLSRLSPERWVDIICTSLIAVFLIVVVCTWQDFSAVYFTRVLYPIIYAGSKLLSVVAAIGTGIGLLYAKFRKRRRWWQGRY